MPLRVQDLPPRRKKPRLSPLGPDGKLCFPPKKTRLQEEEDKRKAEAVKLMKNKSIPGTVSMMELLSGEYWRKKENERIKLEKRKQRRLEREKNKPLFDYKLE